MLRAQVWNIDVMANVNAGSRLQASTARVGVLKERK